MAYRCDAIQQNSGRPEGGQCKRGGSDDGKDEEKALLRDGIGYDIPALLWSADGLRGVGE